MSLYADIEKKLGTFNIQCQFEIKNETLGFLGASGSGKSMTLKCIAGVETPDKGIIVLDDAVVFDSNKKINIPAKVRKTGYLFQNYALFPNMTVEENIACGIFNKKDKEKIVNKNIESLYLKGLEKLYPSQLSGGQQQRTAIARMMASKPNVLMLDEPFSALDSYLRWQLEQGLITVMESFKGSRIYVSHNKDEVYRICDRVAVIDNGKMEGIYEKEDLFNEPKTLAAAMLTGWENISRAERINEFTIRAVDWNLSLNSPGPVPEDIKYVGLRSNSFQIVRSMDQENTIDCQVLRVIEDTRSNIIIFKNRDCCTGTERSRLQFNVPKDKSPVVNCSNLYLKLPKNKLIMMR